MKSKSFVWNIFRCRSVDAKENGSMKSDICRAFIFETLYFCESVHGKIKNSGEE
jgi:hypothetical protein